MGLKLILGNAGSGKSHRLFQHIIDESIKNPDRNYIIVVPEQFTLQTQKDIVRLHPKHGILNIDILSFKRLAIRIFEEVGFNNVKGTMIDDMGKNLILRHVAAAYEDMLPIMGKNIKKIGYISEVKSVISEMMQYNIGFEQLSGLIDYSQKQSLLKGKLQEIKVLYEAFLSYIKDRYVTGEELLDKAGSMVALSGRLKNSSIAFDGYTGFTPVQYKFIQALLENCIDVYDTVLIDVKREFLKDSKEVKANSEHELFYMSKMTIMKLKRLANESNIKIYPDEVIDSDFPIRYRMTKSNMEIDREKADISGDNCDCTKRVNNRINKNLIHLENNLFRADAKKLKKSEESKISEEKELKEGAFYEKNDNESEKWIKKDIGIFSCQTMQDEITEVCKRLEELVRKKGYKYHEIAIVTGDIDGYSKILARKLQKFDIPYFIDKTIPILLNPCTEYIRAFFEVMINNYSYDSMIRYLRSQMTGIEPCEVDLFDNYLVAYGIKGRRSYFDKFTRKKSSYSAELLLRMDLVRERISKDFGLFEEGTAIGELRRTSKAKVKTFSKELYLLLKRKGMEKRL
nr:hypothetical protein [Lachnospiraceae bacterium]